ncbi:arylsulfatase A-like enzyme [Knoellia remsis]|uniref:Arylsulfatase A-like enzyme n=1 Tax=Knoellia remsis TaxID=407159 RepID=A0A2T0UQN0_9MICO|nr:sulfatase-like hydrolase/transferase [Knoellia remsis]PRY60242.1 arylsulfatase A-like enzyme [Knoellia remsis]
MRPGPLLDADRPVPHEHGVFRNGIPLADDAPTLGRLFGAEGYDTAYLGKWHLADCDTDPVPREQQAGYEHWLASNLLEFTSDGYRTTVFDEDGEAVFLPGYRSDALVDAAIRHISRASEGDKPFLLFLSLLEPHHQNEVDDYPAPDVYRDTWNGAWLPPDLVETDSTAPRHAAGYYGQVKRVDEGVGRIRDALKSLDLLDSTTIVYTSDHGSHFKGRNSEYKRSPHDGSVRVPLVVHGPGFEGGRRVTAPVSTVDVVPTLLESAGITVPEHVDGMPLQRFLDGSAQPRDEGDDEGVLIQVSESEVGRALRTRRWKYYVTAPDAGDVPGADSYVETALYDLTADPYELDNRIDSEGHRELADELREQLRARIAAVEGVDVTITPWDGPLRPGRRTEPFVRSKDRVGRVLEG